MKTTAYFQGVVRKRPIVGFAAVGVLSTTLDIIVLQLALFAHAPIWLATAVGFSVGLANGYLLNSTFVFEKQRTGASWFKYALISFGGLGITEVVVNLLSVWHPLLGALHAKAVAVFIVFFWNYVLSRFWAFR